MFIGELLSTCVWDSGRTILYLQLLVNCSVPRVWDRRRTIFLSMFICELLRTSCLGQEKNSVRKSMMASPARFWAHTTTWWFFLACRELYSPPDFFRSTQMEPMPSICNPSIHLSKVLFLIEHTQSIEASGNTWQDLPYTLNRPQW